MLNAAWKLALISALALPAGAQQQSAPAAPAATSNAAAPAAAASTASAPKIENQDSFTIVGVTARTKAADEAGGQGKIPGLWQNAMASGQLEQIPNRVGDGLVVVYSNFTPEGDYDYTLGVRVSSADKIPDGMVKQTIAAGKYAVFQSEQGPPQEIIPALWKHIMSLSPQELGGERAHQTDFETYPPITDPSTMQMSAHIGLK
jgi:predicted transcriptional regulator YdeE